MQFYHMIKKLCLRSVCKVNHLKNIALDLPVVPVKAGSIVEILVSEEPPADLRP